MPDHPSQRRSGRPWHACSATTEGAPARRTDDCGLHTYAFPLVDVARAFALLADPAGHPDPAQGALVSRAHAASATR